MSAPVPVQSNRFKHGDHWLAYEVYGESGTPFLLMHGILLDSHVNRDLARTFAAEGFKVILLDLLGHGNSDKPTDPTEYRNDFFAQQVVGCLDHLKIDRAIVGGVSLGAIVTLQAAAIAPQRIKAMFLEMPVMEWSTPFAAMLLTPVISAVRWGKLFYRPFTTFLKKLPRPRTGWAVSVLNAASADPDVTSAILHGILVGPVVPTAAHRRGMTMPALIVGHRGDRLHAHQDAYVLAGQLPNAKLLNAKSILELRSKPERLMPEILEFLHAVADPAQTRKPAPAPLAATPADNSDLRARFEATVEKVRRAPADGPIKPDNEMKLKMYGLYRQANDGDADGKRPGMMDVVGRFKYDAWAALKGVSKDEAMRRYIGAIETLEQRYAPRAGTAG